MYKEKQIFPVLRTIGNTIEANVDILAQLDGLSGDGDLGETMRKVAKTIIQFSEQKGPVDIGELFMKMALSLNRVAPSTLGTLLSSAIMALAKEFYSREGLSDKDVANIPRIMAEEIMSKGGAHLGDKTILDALIPMSDAILSEFAQSQDISQSYKKGAIAACSGADATKGMVPKAGRAQWIGERVKDNLDGGAVLCSLVAGSFFKE